MRKTHKHVRALIKKAPEKSTPKTHHLNTLITVESDFFRAV